MTGVQVLPGGVGDLPHLPGLPPGAAQHRAPPQHATLPVSRSHSPQVIPGQKLVLLLCILITMFKLFTVSLKCQIHQEQISDRAITTAQAFLPVAPLPGQVLEVLSHPNIVQNTSLISLNLPGLS